MSHLGQTSVRRSSPHPRHVRLLARVALPGVRSAVRANLLEERLQDAVIEDGAIVVPFRPWEIITLVTN